MRLLHLAAAGLLLASTGCKYQPPEPKVEAQDVRVQLPVVPGRPGAAYFTLKTNNDPTKLVSVTSPRIERIELHETSSEGGISRMRPARDLVFDPSKPLAFEPGGKHAMLFGVDAALKAGDKVALTLNFEPAPSLTVEAEVKAFGSAGHEGH